jgi:hypothetical protein
MNDATSNYDPQAEPTVEQLRAELESTRTESVINRSAVKSFALGISAKHKAGKFTRVGEDFITAVEAEVESFIRKLNPTVGIHGAPPQGGQLFITKLAREKLESRLNDVTRAIIFNKVMRHPSVGCTLKD